MLDQLSAVCDAGREHHLCKYPECACVCHKVMLKGTTATYTDLGRIVTAFVNDHMEVFAVGGWTTQMHDALCAKLNAAHAEALAKVYKELEDKKTASLLLARELKMYTDVLEALKRLDDEHAGRQLFSPLREWNWAREAAAITATSYTTPDYRNAFAFGYRTAVFRANQVLDAWVKNNGAFYRPKDAYLAERRVSSVQPPAQPQQDGPVSGVQPERLAEGES
jgi:hypothetical protein